MGGFAWVTLATNDSYSLGALVLAHSLRQVNTVHQLAVLVTPGITSVMREKLASVFNVVVEVNVLDSKDEANLRLLKRPELGVTFTKLHCWKLTQFEKCVFLDADTMVLANADELFDKEEFSAAPDVGWPDCFNSGVFVFRPSEETYNNLIKFALERGSFDGGDQGLLNLYFSDWAYKDISKHLPFIYNTCSTACYSYLPAFKQFGGNVKIIHFIGNSKPWLQHFDSETRQVHVGADIQHLQVVVQQWWNIFCSSIHPVLSPDMAGLAGAFARLTLGAPRSAEQVMLEDQLRRQGWEVGNIDYMGRDSFDNIWGKICETLNTCPAPSQAVIPQEPSHVVPVEEIKQATSLTVDTCMKANVEVQETMPKIDEKMAAEEIKPPVEGITDSFISQVTLFPGDTQTQTSIPDLSILAHATTQSQQPSIPLQEEHKEMHPTSQSITSEALVPSIPISAQTTTLEPSISTVQPVTSSAVEKPLGEEFSDIPDIMEMSKSKPMPLSEPPQQTTVVVEPSQCSKIQASGTPEQLLTAAQPPIPESTNVISELVGVSQQQASATSEEPSSAISHAPKHLPPSPTSNTPDEPAKPTSLPSQPVDACTKNEPLKPTESCVGELQKPKEATSVPFTVDSNKPAPSLVSAPVIQTSIAPETSTPASTQVETPKASIDSSKPIASPIPPKTEAEKVSTPLDTPKSSGKTSGKLAATKPSEPNQKSTGPTADVSPTPPPRKSSGGGGAASKKSGRGKK